ncbi:MAG: phosphoglucosamine mutase, partial [Coriobacteriia bacterium]|nr:phosphoglucosamine mutase [Coriobacteriia bacterium]
FLGDKGRGRIVVGRDTRQSGEMLEAAFVAGLTAGGGDALLCGIVPTPAVALIVRELGADGGVVISASHNPPEYNGIKLFNADGFKLPDDLEEEISAFVTGDAGFVRPTGAGVGRIKAVRDALARYVSHSIATIEGDLSGLTIAVDCGHGASGAVTPEALRRLGATVVPINAGSDGMDINVGCGSTDLTPLVDLVRSSAFDMGIAHDGDADRVLAVDETGAEVDGDAIMAICAAHLHSAEQLALDTVVSTVMCNLGFEIAMRDLGIHVIKANVGDRYVLEQMQASGATLGGEQSGHIIFLDHNTTGDGLVTALQLAAVIKATGKSLSELRQVMHRYPQVLVNVRVADKVGVLTNGTVSAAIVAAEAELGDAGRVLVRASGTEPVVRVMAEAASEEIAADVVERLVRVVSAELG